MRQGALSEESQDARDVLEELGHKIDAGELSVSTPFVGMPEDWPLQAKQQLQRALAKMFGWSKPEP